MNILLVIQLFSPEVGTVHLCFIVEWNLGLILADTLDTHKIPVQLKIIIPKISCRHILLQVSLDKQSNCYPVLFSD